MKNEDRRLHPRLEHNLPVKIVANGYDFSTVTKNVSCVGAYCHIPKYVPPFTRVAIKLQLPIVVKAKKTDCPVECSGVIVRTEDEKTGGFNIAVFFNGIREVQKKTISRYISQFIS